MPDLPSKTKWEAENVLLVALKINRNQEPELYNIFSRCNGSRGALLRELLKEGLKTYNPEK